MDEFPQRSKEAMDIASAKGWFFSLGRDPSEKHTQSLISSEVLIKSRSMSSWQNITDPEWIAYLKNLSKQFPARAIAISAAVRAHKRADTDGYTLSIPVFIAQADGMISEILGAVSALQKVGSKLTKQGAKEGETRAAYALRNKVADEEDLNYVNPILALHDLDFFDEPGGQSCFYSILRR
ncbi:hypothetical protein ACFS4T_11785 [Pseudomonas lini]